MRNIYYNNYAYIMIYCLFITIIFEVLFAYILGLRKKDLINVILVNMLTNPLLNAIHPLFLFKYGKLEQIICLIILEIFAIIIEWIIYLKVLENKKQNPLYLSIILNSTSFFIGLIINIFLFRIGVIL